MCVLQMRRAYVNNAMSNAVRNTTTENRHSYNEQTTSNSVQHLVRSFDKTTQRSAYVFQSTAPLREPMLPHPYLDNPSFTRSSFVVDNSTTYPVGNDSFPTSETDDEWLTLSSEIVFYLYGVIFFVICTLGIFGNIATIVIMTRKEMRSSINTILAGLACFDGGLLLLTLFVYCPQPHCNPGEDSHSVACSLLKYPLIVFYPASLMLQTGSVWACVAITCDRYVAVCYPLYTRLLCTVKRACIVLICVAMFSIAYNLPVIWEVTIDENNGFPTATPVRYNYYYETIYKTYSYLFIMILIPVTLMVVMNGTIVRRLHHAYKQRQRMTGKDEKEQRATVMVIAVIVTFIVLNTPAFCTNMIESFAKSWTNKHRGQFMVLVGFANLFVTFNSAVNFIIYCALGYRFRSMFVKIFLPPCYDKTQDYRFLNAVYGGTNRSNGASVETSGSGIISMKRLPSTRRNTAPYTKASPGGEGTETLLDVPAFDYTQLRRSIRMKVNEPNSDGDHL